MCVYYMCERVYKYVYYIGMYIYIYMCVHIAYIFICA